MVEEEDEALLSVREKETRGAWGLRILRILRPLMILMTLMPYLMRPY